MPRRASASRGASTRSPVEPHVARGRAIEAADDVEQRALAGAVRADERADLAARHLEAHVVERADAVEGERHVAHLEERRRRRITPPTLRLLRLELADERQDALAEVVDVLEVMQEPGEDEDRRRPLCIRRCARRLCSGVPTRPGRKPSLYCTRSSNVDVGPVALSLGRRLARLLHRVAERRSPPRRPRRATMSARTRFASSSVSRAMMKAFIPNLAGRCALLRRPCAGCPRPAR